MRGEYFFHSLDRKDFRLRKRTRAHAHTHTLARHLAENDIRMSARAR